MTRSNKVISDPNLINALTIVEVGKVDYDSNHESDAKYDDHSHGLLLKDCIHNLVMGAIAVSD